MHYIGIDIGGSKIAGGIVTQSGLLVTRQQRPTPIKEGGQHIVQEAIEVARSLIYSSRENIHGIGIGAGGQIDPSHGRVDSSPSSLAQWNGVRIAEAFTNALGLPAAADNDVNVFALGECRFGAARKFSSGTVIFLALGNGVGGALLVNGAVHHGAHWRGGEMGQILLTMDGTARKASDGFQGTLAAFCSGPGLVQTWLELKNDGENENENDENTPYTGLDVVRNAIDNPGGPGSQAIEKTGEYLGFGLVTLANTLDPDLIVIGGGLSDLGDTLLEPARRVLRARALPGPSSCPVVTGNLGVNAGIIGAASLVMGFQ